MMYNVNSCIDIVNKIEVALKDGVADAKNRIIVFPYRFVFTVLLFSYWRQSS